MEGWRRWCIYKTWEYLSKVENWYFIFGAVACTLPHRGHRWRDGGGGAYIKPRNIYQKWRIGMTPFLGPWRVHCLLGVTQLEGWRGRCIYKTWENLSKVENWYDSFFGAGGMEVEVHHKAWEHFAVCPSNLT